MSKLGSPLNSQHFHAALNFTLQAMCRGIMEVPAARTNPATGDSFAHMWPPAFDARWETKEEQEERMLCSELAGNDSNTAEEEPAAVNRPKGAEALKKQNRVTSRFAELDDVLGLEPGMGFAASVLSDLLKDMLAGDTSALENGWCLGADGRRLMHELINKWRSQDGMPPLLYPL